MKNLKYRHFIAFALVLTLGLYFADRLFLQKQRSVASLEGRATETQEQSWYDLSDLTSEQFQKAFKVALVRGAQVEKGRDFVGLSMGGFLMRNSQGGKIYACEAYPYLEILLQAEGVAYSGNIPSLIVRGPCRMSDDGKRIQALPIPLKELHQKLRQQPIWKIPLEERGENLVISAQHLYDEWPMLWNVTEIKLSNDQESLAVDGYEIISVLDQALTLDFSEDP